MALRFNQATDQIELNDAPSSSSPWSFCCWVRNIEAIGFGTILRLRAGGTIASFTASSGGSNGPQLATTGGTAGPIVGGGSGSLPANAWRRVAYVINGSGSNNCTVFWGDDDPASDLTSMVGTVAVGSPTALAIGGRGGGDTTERWGGDVAYPRGWAAVRTGADFKAELASTTPVITSGLWADWPLETDSDLTDHSGNGRHLTAGSTSTTTVDGPPISSDIVVQLDLAVETDTAHPIVVSRTVALELATEVDTAHTLAAARAVSLALAVEQDTALPIVANHAVPLDLAVEADTAHPLVITRSVPLGLAVETDTAHQLTAAKTVVLDHAVEVDTAHPLTIAKVVRLGHAVEQNIALPITVGGALLVPGVHTATASVAGLGASATVAGLEAL